MPTRLALAFVALLTGLAPAASSAQVSPALDPALMASAAREAEAARQKAAPRPGGKLITLPGAAAPSAPGGSVAAAVAALNFAPSDAIRTDIRAQAVAALQPTGEEDYTADLRGALSSGRFDSVVGEHLAGFGLRPDNMADVLALYLASAWMVTQGRDDDPTRAQLTGLRDQLALAYAAMPGMQAASDAEKQRIAETGMIGTALLGKVALGDDDDPKTIATAREDVSAQVRDAFGLDLTTLQLTDSGLR